MIAIGTMIGTAATDHFGRYNMSFDERRFDHLLVGLLVLSVIVNLIFLGPVLANPKLMLQVLVGEKGAIFVAKDALTRVVGFTSLTNISPLVFCMCSVRFVTRGRLFPSLIAAASFALLVPLIAVHAFIGSERLVLIENGIGLLLPIFSFSKRFRVVGQAAPFVATFFVAIIFAIGEYTRSWAYYGQYYDSFMQFAGLRFLAYVAGASNTGAGLIQTLPPVGFPLITARWATRVPVLAGIDPEYLYRYFRAFGNSEFNNPSGIFGAIVDFGISIGAIYLFLFGIFIGVIYGAYRHRHPVGLLCYPIFYIGLVDLTQIWYWGEPRFIPELLSLGLVIAITVRRRIMIPAV